MNTESSARQASEKPQPLKKDLDYLEADAREAIDSWRKMQAPSEEKTIWLNYYCGKLEGIMEAKRTIRQQAEQQAAQPAPEELEEQLGKIKETIHYYLGSDQMSDCWGEVLPLIRQREAAKEMVALVKLNAICKHLNLSGFPDATELLGAIEMVEKAAEWARHHIEERGRQNDELEAQCAKWLFDWEGRESHEILEGGRSLAAFIRQRDRERTPLREALTKEDIERAMESSLESGGNFACEECGADGMALNYTEFAKNLNAILSARAALAPPTQPKFKGVDMASGKDRTAYFCSICGGELSEPCWHFPPPAQSRDVDIAKQTTMIPTDLPNGPCEPPAQSGKESGR